MCLLFKFRRFYQIALLTLVLVLAPEAFSKIIRVAPDADLENIQDGRTWEFVTNLSRAASIAESGDEIWLQTGNYTIESEFLDFTIPVNFYGKFAGGEQTKEARAESTPPSVIETDPESRTTRRLLFINLIEEEPSQLVEIDGIVFRSSTGVVSIKGAETIRISDCSFEEFRYTFEMDAGAVYLTDVELRNNSPFSEFFFINAETLTLSDSIVESNISRSPNGLILFVSSVAETAAFRMHNCVVRDNQLMDTGAAIYASTTRVILSDNRFERNFSENFGAALQLITNELLISHCYFGENSSNFEGGALNIIFHGEDFTSVFSNCIFRENRSLGSGAILRVRTIVPEPVVAFENCTFINNSSSDGSMVADTALNIELTNCLIANDGTGSTNTSPQRFSSRASCSHCIYEGSGGSSDWDSSYGTDLGGNLDTSAQLIPGTEFVQASSPAIDAGSPLLSDPDLLDLDADGDTDEAVPFDHFGFPRLVGSQVDIGASEFSGGPRATIPPVYTNSEENKLFPVEIDLHSFFDDSALSFTIGRDFPAPVIDIEFVNEAEGIIRLDSVTSIDTKVEFSVSATDSAGNESTLVFVVEISAENSRIFVKKDASGTGDGTSWENALPTLQSALALATPGTEIWVASGIYYPDEGFGVSPGDVSASFFTLDGLSLFGGFAGGETAISQRSDDTPPSILSGDLGRDDENLDFNSISESYLMVRGENSHTVIDVTNNSDVVFDGFTITGGSALANPVDKSIKGGGAARVLESTVKWVDCHFTGNSRNIGFGSPDEFSGGGAMNAFDATISLSFCSFESNAVVLGGIPLELFSSNGDRSSAGGAVSAVDSKIEISDCHFLQNAIIAKGLGVSSIIAGGGVSINGGRPPLLVRTEFIGNICQGEPDTGMRGGALALEDISFSDVTNCVFRSNKCGNIEGRDTANPQGGAVYTSGARTCFDYCVFRGNSAIGINERSSSLTAGRGGAICGRSGSNLDFNFCLFAGNQTGGEGGAIYNSFSSVFELFRCTIAGNGSSSLGAALRNINPTNSFAALSIAGCIIWGNQSEMIDVLPQSSVSTAGNIRIGDSIIEGVLTGDQGPLGTELWRQFGDNAESDPLFVSAATTANLPSVEGDYHVAPGSPALDIPGIFVSLRPDLDGNVSNLDGDADGDSAPDRGAYELLNTASDSDQDGFTDGFELSISGGPLALAPPSIRSSILDEDGTVENLEFQLDVPSALPSLIDFVIEHSPDLGITSSWVPFDTAAPDILDLGTGDSRVTIRPAAASAPASERRFFRIRMDEKSGR